MNVADTLREAKRETECQCEASDAWRCARLLGLRTIACYCQCHQYVRRYEAERRIEEPEP